MAQTAEVLARGPVSDTLREAARPGLGLQLERLPSSAAFLYEAICNSLICRQQVKEPHRCHIALDTTITLCAAHAGKRLVPTTGRRVERVIARCFTLYDLQPRCVTHALNMLASVCRGGIPVPPLKDLARQVRGERILRAYDDDADYSLTRCLDLTPGAFAGSPTPAEPQAATEHRTGNHRSPPERPHHPRRRLTRRHPCGETGPPETRHQGPIPPASATAFPLTPRACASLHIAHARWGVRMCADFVRKCTVLGWPPPTSKGHTRMTKGHRTWETALLSALEATGIIASAAKASEVGRQTAACLGLSEALAPHSTPATGGAGVPVSDVACFV